MGSCRPGRGFHSSLPDACRSQPALPLAWGKGLAARRLCRPARQLLFPCKAARKARGIHKGRRAMPRASLFMRCRNGFSMRPGNGRFSSLAKACPFSGTCCRSPLYPLPGARASPRGGSAGPPGGCSFHAKPRAKRVAYTRAEGPCRGQASLCGAGMDFPCGPETGGFPPWRKPARFQKAAASSPLCPLPGIKASPRGAPASPPGGFL